MPSLPMPACRYPGCPNLQAKDGRGYCEAHRAQADLRDRRGRHRGSARARGYTRRYEQARAWVLQRQPLCVRCLERGRVVEAEHAHHIIPLAQGGTNDPDNLLPLCRACHEDEHGRAQRSVVERE